MTDERAPDDRTLSGSGASQPGSDTTAMGAGEPAPPPAPPPAPDEPPPLAGYVTQPGSTPAAPAPTSAPPGSPAPGYVPPPAAAYTPAPTTPQPAVAWAAPPPAPVAVQGSRSSLAAIAGIILLVLGILGIVIGALAFAGTAFFSQLTDGSLGDIPGLPPGSDAGDIVAGMFAFVGVIVIAYSIAYIIGGIGVLRSRNWGRVTGIVVAIISGLIWLGSLSGGASSVGDQGSLVFVLIMAALHVYVFFALVFWWRSKPAAA